MKNKINLCLVLIILFISCQEKKTNISSQEKKTKAIVKDHDEIPSYIKRLDNKKLTDSLFNLSINKGDIKAYDKVAADFILDEEYPKLFYYSLIMANKYNYNAAYFHVFVILSNSSSDMSFDKLDKKTKNLALYYLVKANEMGYDSAKYSIDEIFGKGKTVQKSNYYLMEYSKY